jgi:hypothetical protein
VRHIGTAGRENWCSLRINTGSSLAMFAAILRASSFVSNLRDAWASNAAPEGQSSGSRNMLQAIVRPLRPARRLGHWSDHCTLLGVQA